jgi:Tfp pilus assembly protein PilN
MQAVNLLPAYARPPSRLAALGKDLSPARVVRLGGIAAAACALAVGAAYFFERSVVHDRQGTLADTQARLAAVEATAAPLRSAEAASTSRAAVIRTVLSSRVNWENALADFARILPDQVTLQSLQAQSPVPAAGVGAAADPATGVAAAAPTSFTITGTTTSHVRVALVLDRLALIPWLSNVTLASSSHSGDGDQFSISAAFAPTGGAR